MKMMFRRITAILLVLVMTGLLSYTVMAEEAETPAEEPAAVSEELADVQEGEEERKFQHRQLRQQKFPK